MGSLEVPKRSSLPRLEADPIALKTIELNNLGLDTIGSDDYDIVFGEGRTQSEIQVPGKTVSQGNGTEGMLTTYHSKVGLTPFPKNKQDHHEVLDGVESINISASNMESDSLFLDHKYQSEIVPRMIRVLSDSWAFVEVFNCTYFCDSGKHHPRQKGSSTTKVLIDGETLGKALRAQQSLVPSKRDTLENSEAISVEQMLPPKAGRRIQSGPGNDILSRMELKFLQPKSSLVRQMKRGGNVAAPIDKNGDAYLRENKVLNNRHQDSNIVTDLAGNLGPQAKDVGQTDGSGRPQAYPAKSSSIFHSSEGEHLHPDRIHGPSEPSLPEHPVQMSHGVAHVTASISHSSFQSAVQNRVGDGKGESLSFLPTSKYCEGEILIDERKTSLPVSPSQSSALAVDSRSGAFKPITDVDLPHDMCNESEVPTVWGRDEPIIDIDGLCGPDPADIWENDQSEAIVESSSYPGYRGETTYMSSNDSKIYGTPSQDADRSIIVIEDPSADDSTSEIGVVVHFQDEDDQLQVLSDEVCLDDADTEATLWRGNSKSSQSRREVDIGVIEVYEQDGQVCYERNGHVWQIAGYTPSFAENQEKVYSYMGTSMGGVMVHKTATDPVDYVHSKSQHGRSIQYQRDQPYPFKVAPESSFRGLGGPEDSSRDRKERTQLRRDVIDLTEDEGLLYARGSPKQSVRVVDRFQDRGVFSRKISK